MVVIDARAANIVHYITVASQRPSRVRAVTPPPRESVALEVEDVVVGGLVKTLLIFAAAALVGRRCR